VIVPYSDVILWTVFGCVFSQFSALPGLVLYCTEFQEFVRNQDSCRKRWHENETEVSRLKTRVIEKDQENVALQTKLKHARYVSY